MSLKMISYRRPEFCYLRKNVFMILLLLTIFRMTATAISLKDQLLTLRDRENRFDTVQKCRKQQSTPVQSEVTSEHKGKVTRSISNEMCKMGFKRTCR